MNFERYKKQILLSEVGLNGQKKLLSSHILIIGAGGLAVPVTQYLSGAGIGKISIIDGDIINLDNLHRQTLFKEDDVGKFKVEVLRDYIKDLNSNLKVNCFSFFANTNNIVSIAKNVDVVIDCADNFATTYFISDFCFENNICFITASVSMLSGYVGTFCKDSPSVRSIFPDLPQKNINCNNEGVLGTAVGVIGSLQAQLVIFYLLKIKKTLGQLYIFNLENLRFSNFNFLDALEPSRNLKFLSKEDIKNEDFVFDLRNEKESKNLISKNAVRISFEDFDQNHEIPNDKNQRIIFCCKTGFRAWKAAKQIENKWNGEIFLLAER